MTGQEMWRAFVQQYPQYAAEQADIWCYGSDAADSLAYLSARGVKTATASAYPIYALENEPIPAAGGFNVITLTDGTALCVTRTTKVYVTAFCNVSADHAYREGEGDRSLRYWREIHEAFFTEELRSVGMTFAEDMKVVCEEFEVVYPLL